MRALVALGERRHDDRQRGRREQRGAEALSGARGEEDALASGERGADRGEREHGEAGHEHTAAAEHVGEAPTEKQEAAEHQRVARDRPADGVALDLKAAGHVGQGDIDRRDVEDDHQLRKAQQAEQAHQARLGARAAVMRRLNL